MEEAIKNEVLRTLAERTSRFLQVHSMQLMPDGPSLPHQPSVLSSSGTVTNYGCIALAQAVTEMIDPPHVPGEAPQEEDSGGRPQEER